MPGVPIPAALTFIPGVPVPGRIGGTITLLTVLTILGSPVVEMAFIGSYPTFAR